MLKVLHGTINKEPLGLYLRMYPTLSEKGVQ